MNGLLKLIETIGLIFGKVLPPWAAPVIILVLGLAASPWIKRNIKTDEARKLMKTAGRERGAARESLEEEARLKVAGHAVGLLVVTEMALATGRETFARKVFADLKATGKLPVDVLRVERQIEGPQPRTPDEAAIAIEKFVNMGATALARQKWEKAIARWPEEQELISLGEKLVSAESAATR